MTSPKVDTEPAPSLAERHDGVLEGEDFTGAHLAASRAGPSGRGASLPLTRKLEGSDWRSLLARLAGRLRTAASGRDEGTPAVLESVRQVDGPGHAVGWRRAAAWGVDLCLVALFAMVPLAIAGGLDAAPEAEGTVLPHAAMLVAILAFVYGTLAHYLAGATAGKHLLRLQVVRPDGGSPGLGQSAARAAVGVAEAAALGLPVLVPLFMRKGRPLHDVVAGTSVVLAP